MVKSFGTKSLWVYLKRLEMSFLLNAIYIASCRFLESEIKSHKIFSFRDLLTSFTGNRRIIKTYTFLTCTDNEAVKSRNQIEIISHLIFKAPYITYLSSASNWLKGILKSHSKTKSTKNRALCSSYKYFDKEASIYRT